MKPILFLVVLVLLPTTGPLSAQTSFPMITHAYPVAVQRGATTEIAVDGQMNFVGAYKVLFEGTGVTAETSSPSPVPGSVIKGVKMKVEVAKDAPLGVREFRIATSLGISSVGQLLIVDDPVVMESSANNTMAQAQSIKLPCVLAGKLEAVEDLDYYRFEAIAGEAVEFEMACSGMVERLTDLQTKAKPTV